VLKNVVFSLECVHTAVQRSYQFLICAGAMAKTFNIVYSTIGWAPGAAWKKKLATMPLKKKLKKLRDKSGRPNCCDMTKIYFREQLIKNAKQQGFKVVRWPFRGKDAWFKIAEAARTGRMVPGSVAVLCHAWSSEKYDRECVPAWDFYPVLDEVMGKNSDMIYPHPTLDQLHSEKRYSSTLMAPTRFINFVRGPNGWKVKRQGERKVSQVLNEELKKLKAESSAKGLHSEDLMVKKGLSWGGFAVKRLLPADASEFVMEMLQELPEEAQEITVLLQAKLDIISELRWVMVDGELRGKEWKGLKEPKQGHTAVSAGYQSKYRARDQVKAYCEQSGKFTIDELEANIGRLCKKEYAKAVSDAGGEKPLYMRMDFLLDKQGRVWLGERESWGADLNGNDEFRRMNPTLEELATKMITRTKSFMDKVRSSRKVSSSTPSKRRRAEPSFTPSPTKLKRKSIESSYSTPSKRALLSSPTPSKRPCRGLGLAAV